LPVYYDLKPRRLVARLVTLASDIADVEKVRHYFQLDSVVLMAHSRDTVLAL
jgi:hypothetical protein